MQNAVARGASVTAGEFFAGIGLARIGLERAGLTVKWSNDISPKKERLFRQNWEEDDTHTYVIGDVGLLGPEEIPESLDLAWASFPCTDLSLAGSRGGLHSGASSAFWAFVKVIAQMGPARPRVIAIENVTGFASSRSGKDLTGAIRALNGLGYSVDAVHIDARNFVPQSRPRLFLVAERNPGPNVGAVDSLRPPLVSAILDDVSLRTHRAVLPPLPGLLTAGFTEASEELEEDDARWWGRDKTEAFLQSLTPLQSDRLESLQAHGVVARRTAFRRMRNGVARWEVRPDDIAGCLRTSSGGSSRQAVVELGKSEIRIRWMTPSEYAILMGASEFNFGQTRTSEVYSGFGDAVCVPVVEWLAKNYLIPSLNRGATAIEKEAS